MYDFRFGSKWISEYGAVSTSTPGKEIAQRDGKLIAIPGKNGDDYVDNGRYKNVEISRGVSFLKRGAVAVPDKVDAFINDLAYLQGYYNFEDSDHPNMKTEAVLTNFGEINRELRNLHQTTLQFSRKPFWLLKSGLSPQLFDLTETTPTLELENPYIIGSKPILAFSFRGGSALVDYTIVTDEGENSYRLPFIQPVISTNFTVLINCENETARLSTTTSKTNVEIDIPSGFEPGFNEIRIDSGKEYLYAAYVIPRWRCL